LKKRSKKLLLGGGFGTAMATTRRSKSFFASFFSKKEVLSSLKGPSMTLRLALALSLALPAAALAAPSPLPGANTPVGPPDTLVQALAEAYANNATLQEQRAALRQADENVPTAISGWRPTITVTGSLGRSSETVTQLSPGTDPLTGLPTEDKIRLPETGNPETAEVTVTQPIYSGGKVIDQTREAENAVYAARAQLLATEQTVFLNVVTAYVTVISDQHVLDLDRNNQTVLEQQLQATRDQFNVGEITLTSVAQAQASLAQAVEQVEVADGNLEIARENFRELVGEYPGNLTPPQPLALPVNSKQSAGKLAVANNPNVIAAEFTDAANKDAVDVAFAALLPQITVQASGFTESNPSGQSTSVRGGSVLAQLTAPLYQGGEEYAAIRAARAREQQSFAAIIDQQRTEYAAATQAWEALVASRAAIVSTNAEIKANAIALDGTEREEIVGTRTTLDVLNAQQLLLNSQVQQVQNIAQLVTNSYTVAAAIGRLTVTDLGLPVDQYNDLKYYRDVKYAGFGTGESADHDAGIAPNGDFLATTPPAIVPPTITAPPAPDPAMTPAPAPGPQSRIAPAPAIAAPPAAPDSAVLAANNAPVSPLPAAAAAAAPAPAAAPPHGPAAAGSNLPWLLER
jgi:outer membrane protein